MVRISSSIRRILEAVTGSRPRAQRNWTEICRDCVRGNLQSLHRVLAESGYPHEMLEMRDAEGALKAAQSIGRESGFTPVLLVPDDWSLFETAIFTDAVERAGTAIASIGRTDADVMQYAINHLKSLYSGAEVLPQFDPKNIVLTTVPDEFSKTMRATHPSEFAPGELWYSEVALVRVPTSRNWELPLIFDLSDNMGVYGSLELASVCKYWRCKYGMEIVALETLGIEFFLRQKSMSIFDAANLRWEMHLMGTTRDDEPFNQEWVNGEIQRVLSSDYVFLDLSGV